MARILVLVVAVFTALTACSGGGEQVSVSDAWGRPSPTGVTNAAFYMTIAGGSSDDTLVDVTTEVCGDAQIHETMMDDGVMSMQQLSDGLEVPSGSTVMLEPGSFHVMCMNLQRELVVGETIDLTLEFAGAGSMLVSAEIRDS